MSERDLPERDLPELTEKNAPRRVVQGTRAVVSLALQFRTNMFKLRSTISCVSSSSVTGSRLGIRCTISSD